MADFTPLACRSRACLVLVATAALTVRQVGYWHDSETLWRYTLSVTDRNFMAHTYLAGEAY